MDTHTTNKYYGFTNQSVMQMRAYKRQLPVKYLGQGVNGIRHDDSNLVSVEDIDDLKSIFQYA